MEQLDLHKHAREKLKNEIDSTKRILEVGPFYRPLFQKYEANIYYADIKSTQEVRKRYSHLDAEIIKQIVPIDYVIKGTYENTFKSENIKFDYVILSNVLEHIPNPINILLDISTILSENGKLCLLLPDKRYTFDHYRENTSIADLYDVYKRGEKYSTPRRLLDGYLNVIGENNPIKFWNNELNEYPNPDINKSLETYDKFITDFENQSFDGHYWVFTDLSFLKIIENLIKLNIIPYKLISFYPTAQNTNMFGLILELDMDFQNNLAQRKKQINEIHEITKFIETNHLELKYKMVVDENNRLKAEINKLNEILND